MIQNDIAVLQNPVGEGNFFENLKTDLVEFII